MIIPGYEVCQELSRSAWFVLYRGRYREDDRPVLLKAPCGDPSSPFEMRLLAHEYEILQGLLLSGVVRVHALLHHDRGGCLVLEDRGGMPLHALLTSHRPDLDTLLRSVPRPPVRLMPPSPHRCHRSL
jgi:hypothetical protein